MSAPNELRVRARASHHRQAATALRVTLLRPAVAALVLGVVVIAASCTPPGDGGPRADAALDARMPPGPDAAPDADAPSDAAPPAPDPTGFRTVAALHQPRAQATATRLADGRVLIVGGEDTRYALLASVEIFDPATNTVRDAAPLPQPRAYHSATLLPTGEVLIAGGGQGSEISLPNGEGVLASALLYDPATDTWRPAADMHGARAGHRAATLADGRVLVVGGGDRVGYPCASIHPNCTVAASIGSAEIYDARTGMWSDAPSLAQPRLAFSLNVTPLGVIAAGGGADNHGLTSVEIFDGTGPWRPGPSLSGQRLYHATVVLGGRLVVAGGKIANVAPITSVDVLADDGSGWTAAMALDQPRTGAGFVALQSGRGLLVGGNDQIGTPFLDEAAIYDVAADSWTPIGSLETGRYSHAVLALADGSVLVVGGRSATGVLASIERTE